MPARQGDKSSHQIYTDRGTYPMGPGSRDVVCNPPPDRPYDALKDAIISRFCLMEDKRLKQLLHGIRPGDNGLHTPTQLLSYMRSQASSENVLRICWMQAIPDCHH
ncbi:unnamed protein product [Echinostoma caproni]|uniref:DUF4485 domain-containing protein n=1 Tax=Echinostoma caproni TaxID=27848 RepID=A0A183A1J4_9TREM|nr:unnamed protein product [Echinostoma caproni]